MKNKIIYILVVILVCYSHISYGQDKTPDNRYKLSEIISHLSYYWKVDSLANNGLRIHTYWDLLNCKVDNNITHAFILDKLGKPYETWNTNNGTSYRYLCFDYKAMPKEYNNLYENIFISFDFDKNGIYLVSVTEGHYD